MIVAALDLSELVIVVAAAVGVTAYATDRALDALGVSRSSRMLRGENEDLVRRNSELADSIVRRDVTITSQGAEIDRLRERVSELEKRDQAAVLRALEAHEESADVRHARTLGVLTEIRDALVIHAQPDTPRT